MPLFQILFPTFAPANYRRDGRVVDYTGLENRRTETCRGFESLSLRHEKAPESVTSFRGFSGKGNKDAPYTTPTITKTIL